MDAANLQLSPEEMALVMNGTWILTKNSIMGKVVGMFAELSEEWRQLWGEAIISPGPEISGGEGIVSPEPKISRGENYLGLPYVMLDFPRLFGREDVLAIRTMFWWGNMFSVTLHLKGRYKALVLPVIREQFSFLLAAGFHVSISEDEWRHELVPDNYRLLVAVDDLLVETPFLKLSATVGLDQWKLAPVLLTELFTALLRVVLPVSGRAD